MFFFNFLTKILFTEFEGDILLGQAAIFFTGGFETSSTTMSYAIYELARHPKIQEKLRLEIKTALKQSNGKISQDLVRTHYIYACNNISRCYMYEQL